MDSDIRQVQAQLFIEVAEGCVEIWGSHICVDRRRFEYVQAEADVDIAEVKVCLNP